MIKIRPDDLLIMPPVNLDNWQYAQDIMKLGLKGCRPIRGKNLHCRTTFDPDSDLKCIWSSGCSGPVKWDYIHEKHRSDLVGLGAWMAYITGRGGDTPSLGTWKIADPSFGLGHPSMGFICRDTAECHEAIEYFNSDPVRRIVGAIKYNTNNPHRIWANIPHWSLKDKWFPI